MDNFLYLSEPYIDAWPQENNEITEEFPSPDHESSSSTTVLNISITVHFLSHSEVGLFLFEKSFSQSLETLVRGGPVALAALSSMLSAVRLPSTLTNAHIIMEDCRLRSRQSASENHRVWRMDIHFNAIVHRLPPLPENENYVIISSDYDDDDHNDYDDGDDDDEDNGEAERISFNDYTVRFEPASKESIESLEKMKIEVPITCSVCLEDVLVGSDVTRLPCSHLYHGDCIVEWLNKSKFCPLCRFEFPS